MKKMKHMKTEKWKTLWGSPGKKQFLSFDTKKMKKLVLITL